MHSECRDLRKFRLGVFSFKNT